MYLSLSLLDEAIVGPAIGAVDRAIERKSRSVYCIHFHRHIITCMFSPSAAVQTQSLSLSLSLTVSLSLSICLCVIYSVSFMFLIVSFSHIPCD